MPSARSVATGRARGAGRPEGRRGAPSERTPHSSSLGRRVETEPGVADFTFVYGRNPVREALRGRRQVHAVWLVAGSAGDELERRLHEWLGSPHAHTPGRAGRVRPAVHRLPALELTALLGTPDHQGIGAEVDPYPYLELEQVLRSHTLMVALDQIQDPHNLGAIIRTAEGAGAAVLVPRHRSAEITPAVVKASAGATEHAAVVRVRNLADALAQAKEAGFWTYGAAAGAAAPYTAQDYRYPSCFVVGSEGEGLGRRVSAACDVMVALPLSGRMESLNVSVSAGILLYEAVRQRASGEAT